MTRRHFIALASALRDAHPHAGQTSATDLGSDYYTGQTRAWERTVLHVARACAALNGAFDYGRFLRAAGYELRPDGSMYPMAAPR